MYSANNSIKPLPETETEFKLESITGYLSDKAISTLGDIVSQYNGFTVYDLQTNPKQFIVGKTGFVIDVDRDGLNYNQFGESLRTLQKLKDIVKGEAIGVWKDSNKLYFDIVETYNSLNKALQVAKERNEIAIFNRVTGKSINVQ